MRTTFKKFLASGNVFIWGCAAGVSVSLLMVFGLLLLIMINGLGYFWTSDIVELTLKDGQHVMGQLAGREVIPRSVTPERPEGKGRLRVKIGNRDLYGLDFKWVNDDQIVSQTYPTDTVLLERREWGNLYARIKAVYKGETLQAEGNDSGWIALAPLISTTNALHQQITRIENIEIGSINADIEQTRLKIRAFEMGNPPLPLPSSSIREGKKEHSGPSDSLAPDTRERGQIDNLKAQVAAAESRYQEKTLELETLRTQFNEYSVLMVDANGREKQIPMGQIIRALRPNQMGLLHKSWTYLTNVWSVLSTEPREANTEGGIFPAIFGTVMMVIIMSLAVVPFGVLAALYLREYAKQGTMVRLVRIAVNNLAGVPSIVFGVFGLGFFIYAIGGTLDTLFFPERLPTPTFGTGGILWASLTLALLTVPVVIVATEEGLAAVPREFREGSLALGATKLETMLKVVIPCALPGILTGLILAMARAAGEVAPLMLTGVVKLAPSLPVDSSWPFFHFDRKFMHLGFHIYDVGFQSPNVEAAKPMVYITTLVLITVVVLLNFTAIILRNHLRKKYAGSVL
jgi:phosphate transport system permease protein